MNYYWCLNDSCVEEALSCTGPQIHVTLHFMSSVRKPAFWSASSKNKAERWMWWRCSRSLCVPVAPAVSSANTWWDSDSWWFRNKSFKNWINSPCWKRWVMVWNSSVQTGNHYPEFEIFKFQSAGCKTFTSQWPFNPSNPQIHYMTLSPFSPLVAQSEIRKVIFELKQVGFITVASFHGWARKVVSRNTDCSPC